MKPTKKISSQNYISLAHNHEKPIEKKTLNKTEEILENLEAIEASDSELKQEMKKIAQVLEATGIRDFVRHLRSPWRIIWTNFLAGISRGLGILMGMTVVVGLCVWMLSFFVDFPLIGQFFKDLLHFLEKVSPPANAG